VKQQLKKTAMGALVSALLFLAMQYLLAFYFSSVSNIPNVYGSIATAVIMVVWLYVTGLIVFFGAGMIYVMQDEELSRAQGTVHTARLFSRSVRSS